MSALPAPRLEPAVHVRVDERRGRAGMRLFILSEAALFLMFFFSYFYLRSGAPIWGTPKPKLLLALVMLAVLLSSSALLHWGQRRVERGEAAIGRWALRGTALLGIAFLIIQGYEYRNHLKEIRPSTNAYGSLFYLITSVHGLHVLLGVLMLLYVSILPRIVAPDRPPHRPVHAVAEYWHFVDLVWIAIVLILYVGAQFS